MKGDASAKVAPVPGVRDLRLKNVEGCEPLDARFANVDPLYK